MSCGPPFAGRPLSRLVLATVCLASAVGCERPQHRARPDDDTGPNILLLVNDAWRKDSVGCYNPRSRLTPRIDALARKWAVFENPVAQSPCTINSAPSILFGVYPSQHQYLNYKRSVSTDLVSVAEILKQQGGYATYGFSTNPHVSRRNGLAQGFDTFIDRVPWASMASGDVNLRFQQWLAESRDSRFFALLWYLDTHEPYDPPDPIKREFVSPDEWRFVSDRTKTPAASGLSDIEKRVTRELYDASVSSFDRETGKLIDFLERESLLDNTAIILTADHGEAFWDDEDGLGQTVVGHATSLNEPQIDVPLLIHLPGMSRGLRVAEPVQHVDLLPTVLEIAGLEFPGDYPLPGESLVPAMTQGARLENRPIFIELTTDQYDGVRLMRGVRFDSHSLVYVHEFSSRHFDPPREQFRPVVLVTGETPTSRTETSALKHRMINELSQWNRRLIEHRFPSSGAQFEDEAALTELELRLKTLGYME